MIVCLKAHQSLDGTVRWFKSDDWYEINTHAPLLNATKMVIVVTVLLWNSIYWYVPFHMFQYTKNRLIFSMFNVSIFSLVYWLTSHVLYSRTFFLFICWYVWCFCRCLAFFFFSRFPSTDDEIGVFQSKPTEQNVKISMQKKIAPNSVY